MITDTQEAAGQPLPDASLRLTQRAYLNAISSLLDYGSRMVVSFVITPVLVAGLGSMLFGVWQVLTRTVSYIAGADGRPAQALKFVMAGQQSTDDVRVKREAIGSALGAWMIMTPVLGAIGLVIIWLSPMITNVPVELYTPVRITCSLLVVNLILTGLITIPVAVLQGMNLGYKRMGLVAGLNVLGGALMLGAVYLNWGLIGIAAAQIVQGVLTGMLFWYMTKVYLPWFSVTWVPLARIKGFLKLSIWYSGWNFVTMLLLSSDVVILGFLISPTTVTNYVLTGYVSQTLVAIATMMVGSAIPGLGKMVGLKQYDRVATLRSEMLALSLLFAIVSGSMVLLWNRSFVTLWVGPEHYLGPIVNFLMVLLVVQLLVLRNETYLIDLTLKLRRKVALGLMAALLSIGLALALVPRFGVIGLSVSYLAGRSLLSVAYPMLTSAYFETTSRVYVRSMARPTTVMLVLFVLLALISERLLASSWLGLIFYVIASFPLVFALGFWFGFSRQQRRVLAQRLRSVNPLKLGA